VSKPASKPKQSAPVAGKKESPTITPATGFQVRYPAFILAAVVLLLYFPSFSLGFTELDDTIFVKEFARFNEDLHNLFVSFTRGLFDAGKDPYYRPLFSDAMILNYHMSGIEPGGYHAVNILLHLTSVLLLFRLLPALGVRPLHSFLLALLFAVHPVLVQAVSWIPGRNDTMLAIFVFSFLLHSAKYTDAGKLANLLLSGLFLALAFFTKETAVFAAPAAFCLLVLYKDVQWKSKNMVSQYAVWALCFLLWFVARSAATIQSSGIGSGAAFTDMLHRLPVILQYLGKIVLPVNQSVFPIQEDTVIYFGLAALALLAGAALAGKPDWSANGKKIVAGVLVFLLFLAPALLVPARLNQQVFEHRLYLPVVGILLLLPQTIAFRSAISDKTLTLVVAGVCVVFAILNVRHQSNFSDPRTFWSQAVETSPHSAYANMMLAARLDKSEARESEALFRKAYALNPDEKYLNFYMGELLQKKDSVLASEPYLLKEKQISNYTLCDFYLARVAMEKKDIAGAISYLQTFLKRDPYNSMANNNLLLLYIEMHQPEQARAHIAEMRRMGMEVPPGVVQQLGR
jgi:protein O-mannosyl-transferase